MGAGHTAAAAPMQSFSFTVVVPMPKAAPRPCTYPCCGALVHGGSRCPKHPAPAWVKVKPTKRVTGRRLQRMREELFQRDPLCAGCRKLGLVRLATQRDHVVPLEEGGADDASNTQGLCDECHEQKTLAEALRGRARGGGQNSKR